MRNLRDSSHIMIPNVQGTDGQNHYQKGSGLPPKTSRIPGASVMRMARHISRQIPVSMTLLSGVVVKEDLRDFSKMMLLIWNTTIPRTQAV